MKKDELKKALLEEKRSNVADSILKNILANKLPPSVEIKPIRMWLIPNAVFLVLFLVVGIITFASLGYNILVDDFQFAVLILTVTIATALVFTMKYLFK